MASSDITVDVGYYIVIAGKPAPTVKVL